MASLQKFKMSLPLLVVALIISLPLVAFSKAFRVALLPDKGENFGCGTCHINPAGGGAKNPFGQDWEKIAIPAGDKYVADLGKLDSDKDQASNDDEFRAKTNPGDPKSKPVIQSVKPLNKSITTWSKIKSK